MTTEMLRVAAGILILIAFILLVTGLAQDKPLIWSLGLTAVSIAMLMSLATRWVTGDQE